MKRKNISYIILCFLIFSKLAFADDWNMVLKSKVEVRNWKLSSKAYKQETFLQGASIELYNGSALISKTVSDKDGNFEINIPSTGAYTLLINYPGYNPKKFIVNSKNIPVKAGEINFIPTVDMTSFIAPKSVKGVGDLGLNQPIIKAERNLVKQGSNKSEKKEPAGFSMAANVNDAEYRVIQKFCTCNKLGDVAMQNKNFALAKTYYLMATDIMGGEVYPKEQLKKAEVGMKMEKAISIKKQKAIAKKSKSKTKTDVPNQDFSNKPVKSTDLKNSSDGVKPARKIRKTLGK